MQIENQAVVNRQYTEAIVSYEEAVKIRPDYAEAWNNLGIALGNLDRHADALATFEKALEIKPDYADAQKKPGDRTQAERGKALNARPFTAEPGRT